MIYSILIPRHLNVSGSKTINSEKFYLKSVTPEERAKIEYEDTIENYARLFDIKNMQNYYGRELIANGENL